MTTDLSQLQRDFLAAIYQGATGFLDHVHAHARVPSAQQVTLYRQSIVSRLQKALQAIYPVCLKLVGPDFFGQLSRDYVEQTPSRTPDLNAYGERLADFIASYAPAESVPYLGYVARLEWAWHHLYGAPDTLPFDFQKLVACYESAGDEIVLSVPPRMTLLTSHYPVHRIFAMNQDDTAEGTLTLLPDEYYHLCIWQQQHVFQIEPITPMEWQVLVWMQQGYSLGRLCDAATRLFPDLDITALLPDFVKKGWIADVMIHEDSTT